MADCPLADLVDGDMLTGPDAKSANSFEPPDLVRSQPFDAVDVTAGRARLELPRLPCAALTFSLER